MKNAISIVYEEKFWENRISGDAGVIYSSNFLASLDVQPVAV